MDVHPHTLLTSLGIAPHGPPSMRAVSPGKRPPGTGQQLQWRKASFATSGRILGLEPALVGRVRYSLQSEQYFANLMLRGMKDSASEVFDGFNLHIMDISLLEQTLRKLFHKHLCGMLSARRRSTLQQGDVAGAKSLRNWKLLVASMCTPPYWRDGSLGFKIAFFIFISQA